MPKIGLRIMKSSLAVGVCFLISLVRSQGIVFYSCIAAVLCIQQDVSGSKKVAINRVKGTLLGGSVGMLVLFIEKSFLPMDTLLPRYLLISVMIIPVIYLTVLLKMTTASYISCVVFMSITVSHAFDVNPLLFATNRMIDTLIGIFVALAFNTIHFLNHKETQRLFVSDLDHTLLQEDGTLSAYTKVKLKQLLEQGAQITIATHRTPATCLPLLQEFEFPLPLVMMNGAVLYDMKKQEYLDAQIIDPQAYDQVMDVFEKHQVNCFVHAIIHHMLHVYYGDFQNEVEEAYYHSMRKTPYKAYVYSKLPKQHHAVFIRAIHEAAILQQLYQELKALSLIHEVHMTLRLDPEHDGYAILDLYSHEAGKKQAVDALMKEHSFQEVYVYGDDVEDLPLMGAATKSFAVKYAKKELFAHASKIGSNDEDSVVQSMQHHFHKKLAKK